MDDKIAHLHRDDVVETLQASAGVFEENLRLLTSRMVAVETDVHQGGGHVKMLNRKLADAEKGFGNIAVHYSKNHPIIVRWLNDLDHKCSTLHLQGIPPFVGGDGAGIMSV